jgi:hypothetical protein
MRVLDCPMRSKPLGKRHTRSSFLQIDKDRFSNLDGTEDFRILGAAKPIEGVDQIVDRICAEAAPRECPTISCGQSAGSEPIHLLIWFA